MASESKKGSMAKRIVKKAKGNEVAINLEQPVSEIDKKTKKTATKSKKVSTKRKKQSTTKDQRSDSAEITIEQIQLRAYFVAESRLKHGLPGDATSDWVQAEKELREELGS
jgi:hypothetical protein